MLVFAAACGPAETDTSTGEAPMSATSASSDGAASSSGVSATGVGPGSETAAADTSSSTAHGTGSTESTGDGSSPTGPALPACGDGNLDPGEDCDDGNLSDDDSCTSACVEAFCGDGLTWVAQEECDDGDAVDDDGCTNGCVERFPEVYVRVESDGDTLWRYLPETDTYEVRTGPSVLGLNLGYYGMDWDGSGLWLLGEDFALLRYDPPTDTWTIEEPSGFALLLERTRLVWTPHALFAFSIFWQAGDDYGVYRDGAWYPVLLDFDASRGADYDPVADELLFRVGDTIDIRVVDPATDELIREVDQGVAAYSHALDVAFVDGEVVVDGDGSSMMRIDVQTGALFDTGVTPTSYDPELAADIHKRQVYIAGGGTQTGTLERYDVDAGTLTPLASFSQPGVQYDTGYVAVGYANP